MKKIVSQLSLALLMTLATSCEKKNENAQVETSKEEKTVQAELPKGEESKVVAEFPDGTKLTMEQVYEQLSLLPPEVKDRPFSKLYAALLRRLIDTHILNKAAQGLGLDKDATVTDLMNKNAETMLQKLYVEGEVAKLLTDDELKKNFEELKAKLPKDEMEVQLKHILLKNKEDAEAVLKELTADSSKFEEIAKQKSVDPQTKGNGGNLGYVRKADLPESFAKVVFEAKAGAVLPQVIDMGPNGFSVVLVGEKRPVEPPKFEQVKAELSRALMPKYAMEVIKKLKKQAGIEVMGLDGKPIVEKTPEQMKEEAEKGIKKPEIDMSKLDDNMVVAKFKDGHTITLKDVKEATKQLQPQLRAAPFADIYEPLALRLVDMKLILDAAKASGLDKDKLTVKKLEDVRVATLHKAFLDKKVGEVVNDGMLKAKYQELMKLLPKNQMEVRLRHIMVKTKEEAEAVIKDIKSGKAFDDLVKEKSIDDKTKEKKGEIGYVKRDELPADFANVVFSAAKATLVPNPVSLGKLGWSVVRVEDKRPIEPPKYEEVKGELQKVVESEKIVEVLEKMRVDSGVKAFDMNGGTLSLKEEVPQAPAAAPAA
ncbi:MAG: peptidylprolyl isomerase [Pseudomonadota bacterium]|jgi:peptidyl-prolyl cis-trans isomerase C|nr:peptidyl-prolyl cis-trans isomerase [Alphaproteobacteria bacterium]